MKNLNLLITAVVITALSSCSVLSPNKTGCGNERDVMRHDARPFRVMTMKEGGTIAKASESKRTTLVSVRRTMKGFKHLFVTDAGDSIVTFMNMRYKPSECYLLQVI